MDAAVWGFIGVVVGGIVTGLATIGVEWVRSNHESTLDRDKRVDNRRLALEEFQRNTLVELQRALLDQARAEAEFFMHRLRATKEGAGHWSAIRIPDELDERNRALNQTVSTLTTRVVDDEVRQMVEALSRGYFAGLTAASSDEAERAFNGTTQLLKDIQDRTGELIRATFRI